jgi:hypothetical protein
MSESNPASRRDDPAGRQHHASDDRAWIQQFRRISPIYYMKAVDLVTDERES